jgi:hypothetical protein
MVAAGLLKDLGRNPHTQGRDRLPTSSIFSLDLEILKYRHKILWLFALEVYELHGEDKDHGIYCCTCRLKLYNGVSYMSVIYFAVQGHS